LLTVTCITAVKCILPLLFESPSYYSFFTSALYEGEWSTSPPSHFTHGETVQSWFGCFGKQLFKQASIPLTTNYTNKIIYQKVNATLMNSNESITATTVPVITQVFSSRKFMLYILTWTI